jgi:hypothetical protein
MTMLVPRKRVLGAAIVGLLLVGSTLGAEPAGPARDDRQLVFEVQGLTCPAVAGLG